MLRQLMIRNLALVDDLNVGFGEGLNVITGETGAGKSLLMGALRLLLGERADRSLIRTGESQCTVVAEFELSNPELVNTILKDLGHQVCDGGLLIIRRVITESSSRNLVNDEPVTLQVLKRLGEVLVDIHGAYDHQSLLDVSKQLKILDAYGDIKSEKSNYISAYREYRDIVRQLEILQEGSEEEFSRRVEFLSHRLDEIEFANLSIEEECTIEKEHEKAANLQEILELSGIIRQSLLENEAAAFEGLSNANNALKRLQKIFPEASEWNIELEQAIVSVQEIVRSVESMCNNLDGSPEKLQWLDERLTTYRKIKRKYGNSIQEVLKNRDVWRKQLDDLEDRDKKSAQLEIEKNEKFSTLMSSGRKLKKYREEIADNLSECITKSLSELGFNNCFFDITFKPKEPAEDGIDEVEFGFAPNVGEDMRPLRAIASSGEISRVMLALKSVLANQDKIPVLVFDEIDSNIGGEIGGAVGRCMAKIAKNHQLISITHLPQVAACGNTHIAVEKQIIDGRTHTEVILLDEETRPLELARMLGGLETGQVSIEHAKAMLEQNIISLD